MTTLQIISPEKFFKFLLDFFNVQINLKINIYGIFIVTEKFFWIMTCLLNGWIF
jgi:hypothetical protein